MSFFGNTDFALEVVKGNVPGHSFINKFGRNPDIDTGSDPEDVWDVGGIWVAPTTARIHDIASTSASDTSAGTGVRTVQIYGLTDWDTKEVNETVTMNGTTNVPTANSYVIIHRMIARTAGSGGTNAGDITATAQTDATVTAQITTGIGQTLMAIYGFPSVQTLFTANYYISWGRSGGAANEASNVVYVKENADQSDSLFVARHFTGVFGSGNTFVNHPFPVYPPISGPAIIKIQTVEVSANNTEIGAGFNAYLVDN